MVKEFNTFLISTRNNIDTVKNTEKSKTSPETVDTSKSNKMTQLTKNINQNLFQ